MTIEYSVLLRRINGIKNQIKDLLEDDSLDAGDKCQALDEIMEYADQFLTDLYSGDDEDAEDSSPAAEDTVTYLESFKAFDDLNFQKEDLV